MSARNDVQSLIRDPDIDAVEIKITVIAEQEGLVRETVREDDLEPVRRRVFFFDTRKLELLGGDVVLRARVTREDDDSTVKLRPVDPAMIGRRWKGETNGFEIELDIVGDEPTCSAKLEETQQRGEIDAVADEKRPIEKLFSDDQEDLIREYKPDKVSWEDLKVLGPIEVEKWEWRPPGFPHEVSIEEWCCRTRATSSNYRSRSTPTKRPKRGMPSGPCWSSTSSTPTVIPRRRLAGRSSSSPGTTNRAHNERDPRPAARRGRPRAASVSTAGVVPKAEAGRASSRPLDDLHRRVRR
jgi:hypothetical protein